MVLFYIRKIRSFSILTLVRYSKLFTLIVSCILKLNATEPLHVRNGSCNAEVG